MGHQTPVERARSQVERAIASGTLTRPEHCESCGRAPKRSDRHGLDAHHVTYSRPLDVTWLCASCHQRAHPRPPRPGSVRFRVEAELRANPRRSDAIIAQLAACTQQAAGRWRRLLEASGQIPDVEPADRASITRTWTARPPRLAVEQGATTPAEVMQLASVSYGAAWRALDRARSKPRLADAAAACDTLSVVRTRAPVRRARPPKPSRFTVGSTPPPGYYAPPDPVLDLPCCTAEYTPAGWVHDRACVMRLAAR